MLQEAETTISIDSEQLDSTVDVQVESYVADVKQCTKEPNLVIEEILKGSGRLITLWSGDHSDHIDVNFPYGDHADAWSDKA